MFPVSSRIGERRGGRVREACLSRLYVNGAFDMEDQDMEPDRSTGKEGNNQGIS